MEQILTVKDAVELTGMTERTIRKWIVENRFIVYRKLNGRIEIDKKSFDEYIETHRNQKKGL